MSKKKDDGDKQYVDFVSQDKDWRGVIDNELRCQEAWQKDWGFLIDKSLSQKPLNKEERLQVIEEKLKAMDNVKLTSTMKQNFQGGQIDYDSKVFNRLVVPDLQPQSRRPKALSKAYVHLKEKRGDDFESQPYDNFLGSK